jgi:hypothetical protein
MDEEPLSPDDLLPGFPAFMKMGCYLGLKLKAAAAKMMAKGRF